MKQSEQVMKLKQQWIRAKLMKNFGLADVYQKQINRAGFETDDEWWRALSDRERQDLIANPPEAEKKPAQRPPPDDDDEDPFAPKRKAAPAADDSDEDPFASAFAKPRVKATAAAAPAASKLRPTQPGPRPVVAKSHINAAMSSHQKMVEEMRRSLGVKAPAPAPEPMLPGSHNTPLGQAPVSASAAAAVAPKDYTGKKIIGVPQQQKYNQGGSGSGGGAAAAGKFGMTPILPPNQTRRMDGRDNAWGMER